MTEPERWTRPSLSPSGRARPCGWFRWPRHAPKRRGSAAAPRTCWPPSIAPGRSPSRIRTRGRSANSAGGCASAERTGGPARPSRSPSRSCWRASTGRPPPHGRPWAARSGRPTRWRSRPSSGTRSSAWTSWTSWVPRPCATPYYATGMPAGWSCRAAPGRPAAPTRPGSPPVRPRCSSCSATGCPTPKSPSGSSSLRRPWVITSPRCCASSGADPVPVVAAALRLGVIAPR